MIRFNNLWFLGIMLFVQTAMAENVWQVQSGYPNSSRLQQNFMQYFIEPVNEKLKGELSINVLTQDPAQVLFPTRELFSAVKYHEVDGVFARTNIWGGVDPVFSIVGDLPAAWKNSEDFMQWYDLHGYVFLEKAYDVHGLKMLGYSLRPAESLVSMVPIRELADFDGKVIRTASGSVAHGFFQEIGAIPREMSFYDVKPSLKNGRLDIADYSSLAINFETGIYNDVMYTNYPGFHSSPLVGFVVNKKSWSNISPKAQRFILKQADVFKLKNLEDLNQQDALALPQIKEMGVTIHKWDASELQRARQIASRVWREYAKGSDAAIAVLDSIEKWHSSRQ